MNHSDQSNESRSRNASTLVGFYLWRGGLAFCALYTAYWSFDRVIRALLEIGVPAQLVWGAALFVFGILLLVASLIVERVIDARAEQGLQDL
ncbi:MAG: hypothetical protein HKN13_11500 [Rhodothermales bacterium]|nr:hypothetical protein [Rhodothermales bacterium]